jgi:hypothetical protein
MDQIIEKIEVKLPVTGQVAVISSYLTTGQSRELQKILLSSGSVDVTSGKLDNINPVTYLCMQEKASEMLVKEYIDTNGVHQPFTSEWLYNLPVKDGETIYTQINEITSNSSLTDNEKKN